MAGRRSSFACPSRSKPGDWGECSVPHSRLVKLQTQGLLPPAFIVSVRAGIATYDGGEQAEGSPNPSPEERICLIPHLLRGVGFPNHPFLRAPGVLRPPVAQPYPCLHSAYSGVRRPLRAIFRLRTSLRIMEEAVLPCPPQPGGIHMSSGWSRSMAHDRDRIPIRYT